MQLLFLWSSCSQICTAFVLGGGECIQRLGTVQCTTHISHTTCTCHRLSTSTGASRQFEDLHVAAIKLGNQYTRLCVISQSSQPGTVLSLVPPHADGRWAGVMEVDDRSSRITDARSGAGRSKPHRRLASQLALLWQAVARNGDIPTGRTHYTLNVANRSCRNNGCWPRLKNHDTCVAL